ncbi:MAG: hypothetical protein LBJ61_10060 [Deltaproteobacteria bacterium]|jgi:hypothetical protein|nr:hypothetical protein [Deltaproteobacteria bacterium]
MRYNKRLTKAQNQVLGELEKLATQSGLKVSLSKLSYAGLKLKGGECRLREEPWVVIDNFLPFEDQLYQFRQSLSRVTIPQAALEKLSPQVRAVLAPPKDGTKAKAAPAPPKAGAQAAPKSVADGPQAEEAGEFPEDVPQAALG